MERLPRQTKPVNCPRTDGEAVGIPGNPGRQPTNDQQTTGLTTSQRPGEQLENQLKQAVIGKYSRQSSRPTVSQRPANDRRTTGKTRRQNRRGTRRATGPSFSFGSFRASRAPSGLLGFLRFLPGPVFGFFRAPLAPSGSRHLALGILRSSSVLSGTFRPRHPPAPPGPAAPSLSGRRPTATS